MIKDQLSAYIKRTVEITDDELIHVLSFFKTLKPQKNELLLSEGQTSQRSFFVGTGCLRIYFKDENGQDSTRYIAFENMFATALVSFITGQPSLEYIQAIEPSELLYITHEDFNSLRKTVPAWEKFYCKYLEKAYVNTASRLLSFTTMDATERYKQLLSKNQTVVMRLPNKIVASYLNISQETLSRLKSKI
ncbi:MAG: Crp/Fnr family transcriptional regulator [Bacteroidetes bacterium]|nr:Crp/Fnr family transcriptional regulator [Bacteroidota bacterium]